MIKKKICSLSQLENNNYFKTWVKEFKDEIIVFRSDKKIYVKSSICPHFGGPLSYDKIKKHLFCYWHGLEFSLNGKCLNQKTFKARLNNYDHKLKDNYIYIYKDENS